MFSETAKNYIWAAGCIAVLCFLTISPIINFIKRQKKQKPVEIEDESG
jgi:hypothetical protein